MCIAGQPIRDKLKRIRDLFASVELVSPKKKRRVNDSESESESVPENAENFGFIGFVLNAGHASGLKKKKIYRQ